MDNIGFAYSAVVAGSGIVGYMKAQSVPSLAAGLTFGALLAGGALLNSQDPPKPMLQLNTALLVGGMTGYRFYKSRKIMPAGLITALSLGIVVRSLILFNRQLPVLGGKTGKTA